MSIGKYKDLLKLFGFQSFLWTQFLGAFNDNVYKIVVSMLAVDVATSSDGSGYLSLVGAVFILPFFLFSGYAGYLADVFNKRTVLIVTKAFEIVAMGLGFFAFFSGRIEWMLCILFLMALQATFFSPAKYGILPEMLPDKDLSRANGLLEMSTFMAIILGTSIGSVMFAAWKDRLGLISLILIVVAITGTLFSLGISRVPLSGAQKPFQANPWAEIFIGVKRLYREKTLWLTVIGISYFWFLGALLQMDIILFGKEVMALSDLWIGILGTFLAIGIGLGSLAAGRLSGDKVELGLVPLGSIGMGLFSILLSLSAFSYVHTATALTLLGFSGGLFIVPLNALLQQKSGREEKGRLIATTNFLQTGGILLASGSLWAFRDLLQVQADRIILIFGLFTLAATVYIMSILPDFLIRFSLWLLTHTIYRIRIVGQEHVPFRGPALLVCNHMSHMDGLLVGACIQRFVRFMVYRPYYEFKAFHWLFRLMKAIPVSGGNRKEVIESLERAREELRQGHVVCIFAEGAISRTGNLLPFKRGFERIVEELDVPVIPVHLDRLWGSIFSFKNGRFFYKWPQQIPYPVTVSFGSPMSSSTTAWEARQEIQALGSEAVRYRRTSRDLLHLRFIKTAKRRWFSFCMADSSGKELTYGKTLIAGLLLARWLRKNRPEDSMVGLLLPASIAGALANIAVLLAGKVPVNLNFTAGKEAMAEAVQRCGIRTIVTSRIFLAKAKLEEMEGMVALEEVMKQITPSQKLIAALKAFLVPSRLLQALYNPKRQTPDALATVIFSSGSTGVPKGVMLSHHNVLSNVESVDQVFWVNNQDRVMGVLPFFHSFGFTGTLWFPLVSGFGAVYHPNPMDAKTIGEMVGKYRATILISTPTFYAAYIRKCSPEEFSSLRYAVVGAERLREPIAKAYKEKYGIELLEGYGCTEMAPVISVNVPDVERRDVHQIGQKFGTVGHPIPSVAVKVVDRDTGEPLTTGKEGLLLVSGPNRMIGYLGQSEKTQEVLRDGWYMTGDIASIDEDGFITITDRLSRFSKIGGEMVPHLKLEEAVNRLLGDEQSCAVTAVPDEQKGERLVVLYTNKEIQPEALWEKLCQTDLPKLWVPKRDNFYCIDAIPTLGTGKVDLRKVKSIALERAGDKNT
jgi:acyl-[acyl-carrier-protein]-phospholipid O-acyltransferase/long-chain-fatty-acid--[acyl-carrier-protein] ligase